MEGLIAGNIWLEIGVGLVLPALVILYAGTKLARYADILGDVLGLSKTLIGAVLLGATTSLPGITASVVAALHDQPSLAAANAVGGIAAQTAFLVVADLCYRRANLEHDAASIGNLVQSTLLLVVLTIPVAAAIAPFAADWPVHPATALLVLVYIFGLHLVRRSADSPMWLPTGGQVGGVDEQTEESEQVGIGPRIAILSLVAAAAVGLAGWTLTVGAEIAIERHGIPPAAAGALGTAVVTSLPELVTTIAAVRRGALSMAVGGVMGGNAFDVLFLAAADVAYLEGSIYHHAGAAVWFQLVATCTMVGVVMLGMTLRQRSGPANIGFEGAAVLLIYLTSAVAIACWP